MDELQQLQSQFMKLQQQQVVQQLSDRVCADILLKLIRLKKIEVYFTTDGKEYLTAPQIKREIMDELYVAKGRLNVADLQSIINIDLHYIDVYAKEIAQRDSSIHYDSGELLTDYYFDNICEEIEENLQEKGQLNVADLAKRFSLPMGLIITIIQKRLVDDSKLDSKKGSSKRGKINGRLEVPLLFTSSFVERHRARIAGLFSAISIPTNIYQLMQLHHFHESLFYSIIEELISKGRIKGTINGRLDKATFVPLIFSQNTIQSIESFFSQNRFIEYNRLEKLEITDPIKYMKQKYKGHSLITCFLSDIEFDHIDDQVAEAIRTAEFIDITGIVPSPLTEKDISSLIQLLPSLQQGGKHLILEESVILSNGFINSVLAKFNDYFNQPPALRSSTSSLRASSSSPSPSLSASSELRGSQGSVELRSSTSSSMNDEDDDDQPSNKGGKKRGGGRNKKQQKQSAKKPSAAASPARDENALNFDELSGKLGEWFAEFPEHLHHLLLTELKSRLTSLRDEAAKKIFQSMNNNNNAEEDKTEKNKWKDELAKLHYNILLFVSSSSLFPDGERKEIEKHVLKTLGSDAVNLLIETLSLQYEVKVDLPISTISERNNALKKFSKFPDVVSQLTSLINSLNDDYKKFSEELMDVADAAGAHKLLKPNLDSHSLSQLVSTHWNLFREQLENEVESPSVAYHLGVMLLFTSFTNKVVSVPSKLLPSVVDVVKPKLQAEEIEKVNTFGAQVKEYLTAKIKKQKSQEAELLSNLLSNLPCAQSNSTP